MRERAAERLGEAGFDELDVERILELVPLATHNQRGRGTLFVGTEAPVNAEELVRIVEGSMSSPVYELLKRPDELFVVEHAHLQPRFVEDSVRIALRDTLAAYPELGDDDFLLARQVNLETIHTHDVVAERYGTAGELRAELEGGAAAERHTELREWLTAELLRRAARPVISDVAGLLKRKRVSVPARRRLMFGRCRTITASAASAAKAITGQGSSSKTATTGSERAAVIEATDA